MRGPSDEVFITKLTIQLSYSRYDVWPYLDWYVCFFKNRSANQANDLIVHQLQQFWMLMGIMTTRIITKDIFSRILVKKFLKLL